MSVKEYLKKEIIGLPMEIIKAKNKSLVGIKGTIIDETKNMLKIKNHKMKTIIKDQVTLKIKFPNKTIEVDGKSLMKRPHERIKNER